MSVRTKASKGACNELNLGRQTLVAIFVAICFSAGIAADATIFRPVSSSNNESAVAPLATQAVVTQVEPGLTFFLVGSDTERDEFQAGFYDYHWKHYVVLVAGTADEEAQASKTIGESIVGLTKLDANVSVINLRRQSSRRLKR